MELPENIITQAPLIGAVIVGLWAAKTAIKVGVKAALLPLKIAAVLAAVGAVAWFAIG